MQEASILLQNKYISNFLVVLSFLTKGSYLPPKIVAVSEGFFSGIILQERYSLKTTVFFFVASK